MNNKDVQDIIKHVYKKKLKLGESKGHDYASDEDRLKNFGNVAALCELLDVDVTTRYGVAMFYIIMKLDRLGNLLSSEKIPNNESIEDTVIDMAMYVDLLYANLIEYDIIAKPKRTD